jgi:hypothetical protein
MNPVPIYYLVEITNITKEENLVVRLVPWLVPDLSLRTPDTAPAARTWRPHEPLLRLVDRFMYIYRLRTINQQRLVGKPTVRK